VTGLFLWANGTLFAVEVAMARSARALLEVPEGIMLRLGANYARATIGDHRYETLLTSSFLHFSALHLLFNLYVLRQIAPPVERSVGSGRMAPMVLASGIIGSALSAAVGWFSSEERVSAGASGAICGVIGAALVLGLRADGARSRVAWAMGGWLAMLLGIAFVAEIIHVRASFDNAAHFGGAIVGAVFAASWRPGPYGSSARRASLGLSALVVVAAFALALWRADRDPFALMRAGDRYEAAKRVLALGDCGKARDAIAATSRLLPRAPEVLALQQELAATCRER
jgi:rhomboid protease GluP